MTTRLFTPATIKDKKLVVIFNEILAELERAESIFPTFPDDVVYQAAIVGEESGEALQAALNMRPDDPHRGTRQQYRTELIQTAAMAIRALLHQEN